MPPSCLNPTLPNPLNPYFLPGAPTSQTQPGRRRRVAQCSGRTSSSPSLALRESAFSYMHIYIYMDIYILIFICVYIYMYIYIYVVYNMCIYIFYIYVCIQLYVYHITLCHGIMHLYKLSSALSHISDIGGEACPGRQHVQRPL